MSTKETAAQIRKDLKAAGWNSKAISVRVSGGSVNVNIKQRGIDLDKVKEIAEVYRRVHRCHVSGEILSGGNTFIFVEYCYNLKRQLEQENKEEARRVFDELVERRGLEVEAFGHKFCYPIGGNDVMLLDAPGNMFDRVRPYAPAFESAVGHLLCRKVA